MEKNKKTLKDFIQKIIGEAFNCTKKILDIVKQPVVKIIIFFVIGVFTVLYFSNQYQDFLAAIENLKINYYYILLALLLTVIAVTLGTATWWALLSFLNHPRKWVTTAKGYIHSSMTKYIPGFIWHFAGRAYFSDEINVPMKTTSICFIIELMVTALVGGTITSLLYILIGHQFIPQALLLKIIVGLIAALLVVLIILFPKILNKLLEKYFNTTLSLHNSKYYMAVMINCFGWILMGYVFFLLIRSFGINTLSFFTALFFHSASFVAGTLALPFPNGLLVRETILILLGGQLLSQQIFILASILLRLLILISELILNFLLTILAKSSNKDNILSAEK